MPVRIKPSGGRGAHFIKEWRKAKGLTQTQVAEAVGTSTPNISRIEAGEQAYTQDTLEGIARALGVTPSALIDGGPGNEPDGNPGAAADENESPAAMARDRVPEEFRRRLEARMIERGFNMRSLSDAAGLDQTAVRDILKRDRSPGVERVIALARALNVSAGWLIDGSAAPALIDGEIASAVPMPSSHAILIRRAAIQAAERIVAQAGPINAAPRDLVRQIVVEVFGFCVEGDGEPR